MTPQTFTLSNAEEVPLVFESRRGARNITLRPRTAPRREIRISLPRLSSRNSALEFLESKRLWVEKIFERAPRKIRLLDGDAIMIFGCEYKIDQKKIGGHPEFLERRLRDRIKAKFLELAKKEIAGVPAELRPSRVVVRDTASRWGSCSCTGTISLSWRLSFAPPEVMRYVIIHEVAHRRHMDHSPAFWAEVSRLYGPGVGRAKLWLSRNGPQLHKYF
jgi:predicted metal-dependent hydrolase